MEPFPGSNDNMNLAADSALIADQESYMELSTTSTTTATSNFMMNSGVSEQEKQEIIKHIDELKYSEKRDNALLELSR